MRRILRIGPEDQPVYLELNGAAARVFYSKARPASGQAPAPVSGRAPPGVAAPGGLSLVRDPWRRSGVPWRDLLSWPAMTLRNRWRWREKGLEAVKRWRSRRGGRCGRLHARAGVSAAEASKAAWTPPGSILAGCMSEGLNPPDAPCAATSWRSCGLDWTCAAATPPTALAVASRLSRLSRAVSAATEIELRLLRADALQAL